MRAITSDEVHEAMCKSVSQSVERFNQTYIGLVKCLTQEEMEELKRKERECIREEPSDG